ncbi:MAG: F0F1 ATP synthase subunit delta [Actinomycetota bacterium]
MSSSTRQAVAAAKDILAPLLSDADLKFAEEIFAIGSAIASSKQLRNILSDPSAEIDSKQAAIRAVFGRSVSTKSVDFLVKLASLRWSKGSDLVDCLEQLAVHAVASIAKAELAKVEGELFEFRKVVDSDQQLQIALASRQASPEQKLVLIDHLIAGKFSAESALLIRFAVIGSTKRRLSVVLEQFGKLLANFAGKFVANVTVASALSESQQAELEQVLARDYGQIKLNIEVDPGILGGLKIQIAGEVIDGSVANRLKQARMMLA